MISPDHRNLTEQQLRDGKIYGAHKVQTPIIGYKKIKCQSTNARLFSWLPFMLRPNIKELYAIAELEIPQDATIIRPSVICDDFLAFTSSVEVSNKLRTNTAIVKKIERHPSPMLFVNALNNLSDCECYSIHDNQYKYQIGQEQKPIQNFDDSINSECTSGIHFFLEKEDAKNYFFN